MKSVSDLKYLLFCCIFCLTILFLYTRSQLFNDALAQATTSTCPTGLNPVRILNPSLSLFTLGSSTNVTRFSADGKCIVGTRATIPAFGIPTYEEMKTLYYTQAVDSSTVFKHGASSTAQDQSYILLNNGGGRDHLYLINSDLNINGAINGGELGVIFVDGNLNIRNNITQPAPNKGIVFVVKGNINILSTVTAINAVLIDYGTFCSAYDFSANGCPPTNTVSPQLTITGSVIYLNQTAGTAPKFVRDNSSSGNGLAAEIINYDPKYLVLLKNVMARNLTVWKEVP